MGPKKTPAAKTTASKAPAKTAASKAGTKATTSATKGGATKQEPPKAAPEPAKVDVPPAKTVEKPPVIEKPLKEVAKFLLDDSEDIIKTSNWWPYVIDAKDIVGRFLQARDVNLINGIDQSAMDAEKIRKSLLGAIRFGKPFVFDMMEADLYEPLDKLFENIHPGLMAMVLDRSIVKDENYMKLVRDTDSDEYQAAHHYDAFIERFKFVVIGSYTGPTGFKDKMMLVNIV